MIHDCEKQCGIWDWSKPGKCPQSWANNEGGLWCWGKCLTSTVAAETITKYAKQVSDQKAAERRYKI